MATFLFDRIIFGPVRSRRLGVSLGVNLLPSDKKFCNYNCLYCECGWTCRGDISPRDLPGREQTREELYQKISMMAREDMIPDVITFAGNGEPTIHPEFPGIIDDTIEVRNELCPEARIAVLSNSTTLHKPEVVAALKRSDQAILKLDTAIEASYQFINRPSSGTTVKSILERLRTFGEGLIIQTLFFRGTYNDTAVDNSRIEELTALLDAYKTIEPEMIMIYTFERDTPLDTLEKISFDELSGIAERIEALGFPVEISA